MPTTTLADLLEGADALSCRRVVINRRPCGVVTESGDVIADYPGGGVVCEDAIFERPCRVIEIPAAEAMRFGTSQKHQ